jgi:PAS domain S-box-containing protein
VGADQIFTMDNNYRFTYVSPSIRHLRGITPEEAMKEDFKDTLTPASYLVVHELAALRRQTESAGKMGTVNRLEIQQKRKDGSLIWVEVLTQGILDEDGRRIGLTGISRDITDRKRIE